MRPCQVFAYGSLLNLNSAARTIGRPIDISDVTPCRLPGYRRNWGCWARARFMDSPRTSFVIVCLNVTPSENDATNGILIPVSEEEFENLRKREHGYDAVDVQVADDAGNVRTATTFRADAASCDPPADALVSRKYIEIASSGAENFGPDFHREFTESVTPVPYDVTIRKWEYV